MYSCSVMFTGYLVGAVNALPALRFTADGRKRNRRYRTGWPTRRSKRIDYKSVRFTLLRFRARDSNLAYHGGLSSSFRNRSRLPRATLSWALRDSAILTSLIASSSLPIRASTTERLLRTLAESPPKAIARRR